MTGIMRIVPVLLALALPAAAAGVPDSNLPRERGKAAIGMSYLFNVDYVRAGQHGVTGMARVVVSPWAYQYAPGCRRPVDFVSGAYFNYRWRHLGLFPSDQHAHGQWHTIFMTTNGTADVLQTISEIPVPDEPCDLEFYLSATVLLPFYSYVDYSGLNLPVSKAGYSEEPDKVIYGRMQLIPASVLPTGGSDWFLRVRGHRSSVHSMRLSY